MSDFTKVRYTLAVPDLARSTAYYTSVLGLTVDFTAPGWTFLSRGSFRVMLGECTDAIHSTLRAWRPLLVWVCHGVRRSRLIAEYRAADAEFTQALADKPWGMREFGVLTIDGHRIMFGQEQ